jgi:hypothetical protein
MAQGPAGFKGLDAGQTTGRRSFNLLIFPGLFENRKGCFRIPRTHFTDNRQFPLGRNNAYKIVIDFQENAK